LDQLVDHFQHFVGVLVMFLVKGACDTALELAVDAEATAGLTYLLLLHTHCLLIFIIIELVIHSIHPWSIISSTNIKYVILGWH
jgi:hypothetical protein